MYGQICDHCDERRASYGVNAIRVDTDAKTGKVTSDSRDEDWCEECIKSWCDEPHIGSTWKDGGEYFKGFDLEAYGTFSRTYTIEDAPRKTTQRV